MEKLGPERVTKSAALSIFGSQTELAKQLKITRGAVSHWPMNKPIPLIQEYKLRYLVAANAFHKSDLKPKELIQRLASE